MLRLQSRSAPGSEASSHLDVASHRVAAVARVHQHFHLDEGMEQVPALAYLRRLCDDLAGILGVQVEVDGEDGFLPTTSIQQVGMIVNELVTNAAKHGVGTIAVTYKGRDDRKLVVCDEGKGLPRDFDPTKSASSLGGSNAKKAPQRSRAYSLELKGSLAAPE